MPGSRLILGPAFRIVEHAFVDNAGVVTVLAGFTTIGQHAIASSLKAGDFIVVFVANKWTKGGIAGTNFDFFAKSGTAVTQPGVNKDPATLHAAFPANAIWHTAYSSMWEIVAAGTLTVLNRGTSSGSNSTIAIGDARLRVQVLRS